MPAEPPTAAAPLDEPGDADAQADEAAGGRRGARAGVQSLDRASVVDAFAPTETEPDPPVIDGFVQVNLTDDPGRGGVQPDAVDAMVERVLATGTIRLRGVMAVAPLDEEPRRASSIHGHH